MACIDSWKSLNVLNKCLLVSTIVAIFSLIMGVSTPFWITVHIPENSLSFTGNFQADFYVPSKNFKAFLIEMIENDQYFGLWQWCIGGNGCIDLGWISMFISNTDWHAWPDELKTLIDFWIATRAFATLGLVSGVIVTAVFVWFICRRTGTGGCSYGFIEIGCFITDLWIATRTFAIIGYASSFIVSSTIGGYIFSKKGTGRCAYGFMTIGCFITGGLLFVSLVVFYSTVRDLASKENVNISFSFWLTCIASTLYILNGFTFVFAGKGNIGRKNTEKDIGAALLQLSRLLKSSTGTIKRQTTKASKEEEIGAALLHLSCLLRSRTDTIRKQNTKATEEDDIVATLQRVLMSMTDTTERQNIKATKGKEIVAAML